MAKEIVKNRIPNWLSLKKFMQGLHAAYAVVIFATTFIFFFPLLMLPVIFPRHFHLVGVLNRWWARIFLSASFIPYENDYRVKLDTSRQYIFCPNHFSYLDIPSMGLNEVNSIFVGKSDMEKIPLFGFMYKKLHITVNRDSLKSRYSTFVKSCEAIDQGKNLTIFPEGGIITVNPPDMARLKDGAFRTAIEKQIAIIPVTIPFNWIILPDSSFLPRRRKMKIIYHEPIETKGLTISDIDYLKKKTFEVIDSELKKQLNEHR
ncbi:lysophospholipid acyltransferase family protein [Fulvivirga imtechensis]|nr:lysophospholipid acyltransferase family protein [Fulvivirga imtechensis]